MGYSKKQLDEFEKLTHQELLAKLNDDKKMVADVEGALMARNKAKSDAEHKKLQKKFKAKDVESVAFDASDRPFNPYNFMEMRKVTLAKNNETKTPVLDKISINFKGQSVIAVMCPDRKDAENLLKAIYRTYDPKKEVITNGAVLLRRQNTLMVPRADFYRDYHKQFVTVNTAAVSLKKKLMLKEVLIQSDLDPKFFHEILRRMAIGNLRELMDYKMKKLPFDAQVKFMTAAALSCKKPLVILDDPTPGMSQDEITNLDKAIKHSINEPTVRRSIVLLTTDIDLVRISAESVVVIDKGKIVEKGRMIDVLGKPRARATKIILRDYHRSKIQKGETMSKELALIDVDMDDMLLLDEPMLLLDEYRD